MVKYKVIYTSSNPPTSYYKPVKPARSDISGYSVCTRTLDINPLKSICKIKQYDFFQFCAVQIYITEV